MQNFRIRRNTPQISAKKRLSGLMLKAFFEEVDHESLKVYQKCFVFGLDHTFRKIFYLGEILEELACV